MYIVGLTFLFKENMNTNGRRSAGNRVVNRRNFKFATQTTRLCGKSLWFAYKFADNNLHISFVNTTNKTRSTHNLLACWWAPPRCAYDVCCQHTLCLQTNWLRVSRVQHHHKCIAIRLSRLHARVCVTNRLARRSVCQQYRRRVVAEA